MTDSLTTDSPSTVDQPSDLDSWIGIDAHGSNGDKIGEITDFFLDDQTRRPEWMTVSAGWFGNRQHFIPIDGARYTVDDTVVVPYTKDIVEDAPSLDVDDDHLELGQEQRLYQHYGYPVPVASSAGRAGATSTPTAPSAAGSAERGLVRAEEQLNVETEAKAAGRIRLRKYVVTEDVDVRVPVRREVATIVREPLDEGDASPTATIDTEDVEETIVLREEEVIVDKQVVAKERVAVETEVVTEHETISGTVRKEQIEIDENNGQVR